MSLAVVYGQRDQNEPAIIEVLEKLGWLCTQLSEPGVPDLLLWRRGEFRVAEVKSAKGRLTNAQTTFHAEHPGIPILRTLDDAVRYFR